MKAVVIALTAALGIMLSSCERRSDKSDKSDKSERSDKSDQSDPPTATLTDATEVFKRAFWRAPSAGDEILHAERHEWRDAEGVTKWQWFIAVKPSPELVKYLRDDNAFGLIPAKSASVPEEKPQWFSFDPGGGTVFKSPRGKMQLVFQTQNNTLYATDTGGGFQRGAPEPAPTAPSRSAPSAGRLPNTPPPTPQP